MMLFVFTRDAKCPRLDKGVVMKRNTVTLTLTVLIVFAMAQGAWAQGATNFPMIGITPGQTLQLNLVAFPPNPLYPPGPCMAQLGFQDGNGKPLGTTETVTLNLASRLP
jgi:hypothetical protein